MPMQAHYFAKHVLTQLGQRQLQTGMNKWVSMSHEDLERNKPYSQVILQQGYLKLHTLGFTQEIKDFSGEPAEKLRSKGFREFLGFKKK